MSARDTNQPTEQPRRALRSPIRLGVAGGVLLITIIALAGCGDDDNGGASDSDLVAFCEAIERANNANPFGATSREPDLDLFLAGLEEMSAAYKDAMTNAPSEVNDDFEAFASEATQRYDTAVAIDDPTDQAVDAVIFGAPVGGLSDERQEELVAFINTECGIDF